MEEKLSNEGTRESLLDDKQKKKGLGAKETPSGGLRGLSPITLPSTLA